MHCRHADEVAARDRQLPAPRSLAPTSPLATAGHVLEGDALAQLLPHRYPFLLVDRIQVVEPGRQAIGSKRVTAGEWWCDGGNPAMATLPHSLVIEALAQTTCALLQDRIDAARGGSAYFAAADRVRLRHAARPGETLQLAVTLRSWRRGICRTHGVASVDGRVVASATLTTILRVAPERPVPASRSR
ncbi:MAG: beta-hydroxyacyl-ACP dehydratase [Gemmatimonadaceae bacterium]|nr:beta-hydroxyacyl-ACP dehydratase [Gemmatimonadaceae bacterium]